MTQKTFPDVLYSILTEKKTLLAFLIVLLCLSLATSGFALLLWNMFGMKPVQIKMTKEGTLFYFQSRNNNKNFVSIVHPRGWQNSHIEVQKGDRIKLRASGSITISMHGLMDKIRQYDEFEQNLIQEQFPQGDPHTVPPESFLTDEQKKALGSNVPWFGPDGDVCREAEEVTYTERSKDKIFPDAPLWSFDWCD